MTRLTAFLLALGVAGSAIAQAEESLVEELCTRQKQQTCDPEAARKWWRWASLAGPDQVERRIGIDALPGDPVFRLDALDKWEARKQKIEASHGVSWSTDYISAYMHASESPGDSNGFGGSLRFMGAWSLFDDLQGNSGAMIWKVEHRHAYGSHLAPAELAGEVGYAGLLHLTLSDQGTRLTNLYWRQEAHDSDVMIMAGWLDTSDYVDVYPLVSPWTGFFNYVFSTGSASIAIPNEGLGAAVGAYINDNLYVIGGFADTNSDQTDPLDGFDTFFSDREYFKHLDIGWNDDRQQAFINNIHLTLWQSDEREEARVDDGWGAHLSWTWLLKQHWTVFLRGGYAEDGGAILEQSVSGGFAWGKVPGGNQLGVGFNWGVPMESTYGPNLPEQSTMEVFYRIQLFEDLAITPDIQYIRNPALNTQEDDLWTVGVRARLAF